MRRVWSETLQALPNKIPYMICWVSLLLLGSLSVLHSYFPLSPLFFQQETSTALPLYLCLIVGLLLLEHRGHYTTSRPEPQDSLNFYYITYLLSSLFLYTIALPWLWQDLAKSLTQQNSFDITVLGAWSYLTMVFTSICIMYYCRSKALEIKDCLRVQRIKDNQVDEHSLPALPPLTEMYTEFKQNSQVWSRVPMNRDELAQASRYVHQVYQVKKQSITDMDVEKQSVLLTSQQLEHMNIDQIHPQEVDIDVSSSLSESPHEKMDEIETHQGSSSQDHNIHEQSLHDHNSSSLEISVDQGSESLQGQTEVLSMTAVIQEHQHNHLVSITPPATEATIALSSVEACLPHQKPQINPNQSEVSDQVFNHDASSEAAIEILEDLTAYQIPANSMYKAHPISNVNEVVCDVSGEALAIPAWMDK